MLVKNSKNKSSIRNIVTATAFAVSAGFTANSLAQHVHGEGLLTIAQDSQNWFVEIRVPAGDLLGFERAPRTEEEFAAVNLLRAKLNDSEQVIAFDGNCVISETSLTLPQGNKQHDVHNHGEHDHHAHHDEDEHHHGEHAHHDEQEHQKHNHHDKEHHDHGDKHQHDHDHHEHAGHDEHDHEHKGEQHNDVTINYLFSCKKNVTQVRVPMLSWATAINRLNTQWVTEKGSSATILSNEKQMVTF